MPKRARESLDMYPNLEVYWSKSGLMGSGIANQWMEDVFLPNVERDSVQLNLNR